MLITVVVAGSVLLFMIAALSIYLMLMIALVRPHTLHFSALI